MKLIGSRSSVFRRCFAVSVMLLALCLPVEAQQAKKVFRIGYLSALDLASESARAEGIRLALRELGYIEGQNIVIEYRYAEAKQDRLPELAAELVHLKVDIIVASGGPRLIQAAKTAIKTIPIVMVGAGIDLSRRALLKALLVPAATSPALHTLSENSVGSGWNCSKRPFPNLLASRFCMIRPLRPVYST